MISWLGSFVIFQRIRTSVTKNDFEGGGESGPPAPHLDQRMKLIESATYLILIYIYSIVKNEVTTCFISRNAYDGSFCSDARGKLHRFHILFI